jgi:hypothetical protein
MHTYIHRSLTSYTYEKTEVNLNFSPGQVHLSRYNKRGDAPSSGLATEVEQLKPYANVCGLIALGPVAAPKIDVFLQACRAANSRAPAEFN